MAAFELIPNSVIEVWLKFPALLKVTGFLGAWLGLWLPLAAPLSAYLQWKPLQPLTGTQKLFLLIPLYLLVPLIVIAVAQAENVSIFSFGFRWSWATFSSVAWGFLGGVCGLVVLFAVQTWLSWIDWSRQEMPSWRSLVTLASITSILALWIGGTEELVFRGVWLNLLQQDYSAWQAAAIASFIFALLHLVWEIRETLPQLPGLWLMGLILTIARFADGGSLGLAWGLHAGWIWGMTCLDTTAALRYGDRVPAWVTGIYGKPLASGSGILFLLGTGGAIWMLAQFGA
jgi:membrane protease YdiL (CAAX protease family)